MRKFLAGAVAITMVSALPSSSQRDSFRRTTRRSAERLRLHASGHTGGSHQVGVDELPNPIADKQRDMKQEAITGVLNGELQPQEVNGSTVVKVADADATQAHEQRRRARAEARQRPSTSS